MRQVHKIALLVGAIAITAAAVVAVVFLNNFGSGLSAGEKVAQVEHRIKTGLERRVAQAGKPARVRRVSCVQSDASHYECLARAEISGEIVSVPVAVTSDDKRFLWKLGGADDETAAGESTEGGLPSAQSPAWAQITCGDVKRAASERDVRWLARAGEAVASQATATRPNADAERLAAAGARNLLIICRRASNPSYQPYGEAGMAVLTGRRP